MRKITISFIWILFGVMSAYAQLPQNHPWEVTLRNYMAKLDTNNFHVTMKPFSYNPSWTSSSDTVYHWFSVMNALPSEKEILMNPKYLLLSSIESGGQIHMKIGRGAYSVLSAAWWADFNYPGNPYHGNKAIKLRALIPAMVDMMMLTQAHEQGKYTRSDFAGGSLLMYAYAYYVGKNALPDSVQKAYETGMLSMMQDIIKWGPTGIFGDMDGYASVAMSYIAKTLNDPTVTQEAHAYIDRLIKRWFYNAGYMGHGDGFDATYDGIDLYFYSWAERISGYQPLKQVLNKILYLKEYLTVPDPDGYWNGPSHWSTATNGPVSSDQWGEYSRDLADAMISDHALPLVVGNGSNHTSNLINELKVIPDRSYMQQGQPRRISIIDNLTYKNQTQSSVAGYAPNLIWGENHWINSGMATIYMYDTYQNSFYNRLVSLQNSNSDLLQEPFSRKKNFIKVFSNNVTYPDSCTFVTAKLGGYGMIIHTGRLSWWGDGSNGALSGLSGGALSTFWTPQAGTVINGVAGGFQNPNDPDTWKNWQQWSVNTISGLNSDGKPFSAARYRFPLAKSTVNSDSTSATVVATGQIGSSIDGGRTAPNGAIQGQVNYTRKFDINPSGLTVTSTITSDGTDKVKELWEMIPVFLKERRDDTPTAIGLQINNNGKWVTATTSLTQNVTAIQLQRFNGAVTIKFDSPQAVKLSAIRSIGYQVNVTVQNIMIDLLHSGGATVSFPKQASVTYTIAPTLQKSNITPIDQSSGSNRPTKIELKQNYPNPFNPTTNITFELASSSPVTLQIFDILGRLISSPIHNQVLSAGEHHIQFDGDNLASGVYIYRLKTQSAVLDKKMMLIK